jgi:hypothetical protein
VNLEEVAKKAARKIKDGYVPPYLSSNPKPEPGYDVNMRIIGWEAAGNYDVIKPRLKVFYELNCAAKKIRNLSTVNYNNDGGTKTSPESEIWVRVGPESNTDSLYKILCNQRDMIK